MSHVKAIQAISKFCIAILVAITLFGSPAASSEDTIWLATDPWAPYFSPELKNGGYLAEIVKEAFRRAGYQCVIDYMQWKRALELSRKGKYHGLLGAFYSEERSESFEYSDPVGESRMVFFSRTGAGIQYDTLRDLEPYKIGFVHGYHYTDAFESAHYLTKVKSYNTEHNVMLLLNSRLDLIIGSDKVVSEHLKKNYPDSIDALEIIEPPLTIHKLYVPISKEIQNHSVIIDKFNRGLEELHKDGTVMQIMKKHGYR